MYGGSGISPAASMPSMTSICGLLVSSTSRMPSPMSSPTLAVRISTLAG